MSISDIRCKRHFVFLRYHYLTKYRYSLLWSLIMYDTYLELASVFECFIIFLVGKMEEITYCSICCLVVPLITIQHWMLQLIKLYWLEVVLQHGAIEWDMMSAFLCSMLSQIKEFRVAHWRGKWFGSLSPPHLLSVHNAKKFQQLHNLDSLISWPDQLTRLLVYHFKCL